MLSKAELEVLETKIQSLNWADFPVDDLDRKAVHDRLQSVILAEGELYGYTGASGIPAPYDGRAGRADVGWYDSDGLVAAFEIDGSVRKKSVRKLRFLSGDVSKVVISKSTNPYRIKQQVEKRIPGWCHHIDARLYDHF